MDKEMAIYIFVVICIVIIILRIFRSIIASIAAVIVGVMIFRIGWVYDADQLFQKYNLNSILNDQQQKQVYDAYDRFTKRRDEHAIVDTDLIDKQITEKEDEIKQELEDRINERIKNNVNK